MTQDRRGILGLETEHVVFFVPDEVSFLSEAGVAEAQEPASPGFEVMEKVLFESLLSGRKAALSGGHKGGYFIDNGGLVHLEIFPRRQSDVPILEVATPECRTPQDVLLYSRAFDAILEETSERSRTILRRLGFNGRIAFGKTNVDSKGAGLGCHENYLVHTPSSWGLKCLLAALMPLLLVCVFPVYLLFLVDLLLAIAARHLPWTRRLGALAAGFAPGLLGAVRKLYSLANAVVNFPCLQIYALLVRRFILHRHIRELTPFLVTRQVLTGSGHLNFEAGVYELSQRAALSRCLAGIIFFRRGKTVFDLKAVLLDGSSFLLLGLPFWLCQPAKRLSLTVGDSNLSDVANLLKLGVTSLLVEMVEAGETFDDLRLRKPLSALRQVSRSGPWRELRLRSGETTTALEIQTEYLRRARQYYHGRGEASAKQAEILRLWSESLETLSDRPHILCSELDWAAKKQLLDRAILSCTNWKLFFAWGRVFALAGLDATARAISARDLLKRMGPLARLRAARWIASAGLDAGEFLVQRDLHFQARKIDIKYHELGGGTGYQRLLEADGVMRRITDSVQVEKATRTPPQDTRARIRAYYIQHSRRPETLLVTWNEVEIQSPLRHISLSDPFQFRLPME